MEQMMNNDSPEGGAMLIRKIERFLRETGMPPSVFGRRAVRDPRFVADLRRGREPGGKIEARVEHFMSTQREGHHAN